MLLSFLLELLAVGLECLHPLILLFEGLALLIKLLELLLHLLILFAHRRNQILLEVFIFLQQALVLSSQLRQGARELNLFLHDRISFLSYLMKAIVFVLHFAEALSELINFVL